ncbi:hypothetical protein EDB83DRAFT_2416958 [Lactarius deliciosus]|nr:hypothetical protein EDB83DRAFT_2416958 [Lactarius deliciosus]
MPSFDGLADTTLDGYYIPTPCAVQWTPARFFCIFFRGSRNDVITCNVLILILPPLFALGLGVRFRTSLLLGFCFCYVLMPSARSIGQQRRWRRERFNFLQLSFIFVSLRRGLHIAQMEVSVLRSFVLRSSQVELTAVNFTRLRRSHRWTSVTPYMLDKEKGNLHPQCNTNPRRI